MMFLFYLRKIKKNVPQSQLKHSKFSDVGKMKQWIKKSNLDPLNPENFSLFKLFQVKYLFTAFVISQLLHF